MILQQEYLPSNRESTLVYNYILLFVLLTARLNSLVKRIHHRRKNIEWSRMNNRAVKYLLGCFVYLNPFYILTIIHFIYQTLPLHTPRRYTNNALDMVLCPALVAIVVAFRLFTYYKCINSLCHSYPITTHTADANETTEANKYI